MKTLYESILSSTKTGMSTFLVPETKDELMKMIRDEIKEKGWNCDLNHIKTHKIVDMSYLFSSYFGLQRFNGDISKWNVGKVKNMYSMFQDSIFNNDISKWNVSKVENMEDMFAYSDFNKDISKWNVSKVENMWGMFRYSDFNKDISNWKINSECDTVCMFDSCKIKDEYKPKKDGKIIE